MKKLLVLLGSFAFGLATAAADTADADYQTIQTVVASLAVKAPPPPEVTTGSQRFHWSTAQRNRLNDLCEQFMLDHPADPRRWSAAMLMFDYKRAFVKSFDDAKLDQTQPGTVIMGAAVYDQEAVAKHKARLDALDVQCAAATDMPPELRQKYELGAILRRLAADGLAVMKRQPVDFVALRIAVDRIIAAYPAAPETTRAFNTFVNLRRRSGAAIEDINQLLQEYTTSSSEGVSTAAESDLTLFRAQEHPLDWKFTAADGREVDLTKLRGKVVLIDFWATWCHPCIEEIPNVVAVYQKYHDKGFEVVGMTLEMSAAKSTDTPEQAAPKLAATKQKMLAFTQEKGMPWPQYYDGTGWKNPYTTKYGIHGIPRMFLLDQQGKVVTMDARGPKLEAELKRLLKL